MNTKHYYILASTRQRGAIGIFQNRMFQLDALNEDDAREEWFKRFSDAWELDHFTSIRTALLKGRILR